MPRRWALDGAHLRVSHRPVEPMLLSYVMPPGVPFHGPPEPSRNIRRRVLGRCKFGTIAL
jgi:hypothetical protein